MRKHARLIALIGVVLVALTATVSISLSTAKPSARQLGDLLDRADIPQRSNSSIPSRAIKLAGGRIDRKTIWGVWLHGDPVSGNCWSTETVTRGAPFGETYCGYPVPPAYWRLISSGAVGRKGHPKALLFFLMREDVARIRVLVDQGQNRPDKRIEMKPRAISSEQARKSHADPNFTYANTVFSGYLSCVKRVEIFDRSGNRVRNMRPACSGLRDPIEENFE